MSLEMRTLPEGLTASREYWRPPVRGLMLPWKKNKTFSIYCSIDVPYAPPVEVFIVMEASPPSRMWKPKLCLRALGSEGLWRTYRKCHYWKIIHPTFGPSAIFGTLCIMTFQTWEHFWGTPCMYEWESTCSWMLDPWMSFTICPSLRFL